jgi:hypothetical protein
MGIIKSKILKDSGLLLQEYSGELNLNDMLAYFDELYNDPEYLNVSNIFSDFRNARVTLSVKDIVELSNFILTRAPKVQNVNNAILTSKPLVTAYSVLYGEIMKQMPLYKCKIFSTFNASADFIDFDANNLEKLLLTSFLAN